MLRPAMDARCRCVRPDAQGEFVARRALSAPGSRASALHPTIGVHSPLTFDMVDTWMHRSVGGFQYHVVHPGGRSHETFPVNAFESESRRLARFFRMGHTPGECAPRTGRIESMNFPSPWICAIRRAGERILTTPAATAAIPRRYDELLDSDGGVRATGAR